MLSMFLGVIFSVSVNNLLNVAVNPPTTSKPAVLAFSTALSVFLADSTNNSTEVCFKSLRYRLNNSLLLLFAISSSNSASEINVFASVLSPKLRNIIILRTRSKMPAPVILIVAAMFSAVFRFSVFFAPNFSTMDSTIAGVSKITLSARATANASKVACGGLLV